MEKLETLCQRMEGISFLADVDSSPGCSSLGSAVQTLFELYSDPELSARVLDKITASVQVQDALVWCILQAGKHRGKALEFGYIACRLFNQIMFDRLVQEPFFPVALGRRNQALIHPKKTATLTILMEQEEDAHVADEAASLMYTLERAIAEDDFRKSHERAMQNR